MISSGKPSDPPPRLSPEVVRSARPLSIGSMPRVSLLEQELAKERSERAAEADTMAEMLVRLTTVESRAKAAETALAAAERDAEMKVRAAKEQGSGLARKIEDAEGRIAELESELRTARARSAELEKKAKKAAESDGLEQRLHAAEAAAEKSSDRARASEERSLELMDRVSSLQAELTSVQQVAADVQTRFDELTKKHEELEAKHDELREAHATSSTTQAETERRLASVEADLASAEAKVTSLLADRQRVAEEHDEFIVQSDALQKEHAALVASHAALTASHAALEKELATTREHYEKALADARRTEASRVAALEAKNEDTRKVLEGKVDEAKKSFTAEHKAYTELRSVLEAVQTEAAATSAKLTEVSQERDRVSTAMTSLAERVSTLESRETALLSQLGVATTALQRAHAAFDAIESRETEHALRRARDFTELREALRTSFTSLPGKRAPKQRDATSDAPVIDITDEAELISSIAPPKDSSAPPSSDGWDQPESDDDEDDDEK